MPFRASDAFYVAYDYDLTGAMTQVRENGAVGGGVDVKFSSSFKVSVQLSAKGAVKGGFAGLAGPAAAAGIGAALGGGCD